MVALLENTLFPLVKAMDGKLNLDLKTNAYLQNILRQMERLRSEIHGKPKGPESIAP